MAQSPSDTGDKPFINIAGGDEYAQGTVEPVTGFEDRPCCMCRSWEKDEKRLIEHLIAHGLTPRVDGTFVTPIAKDFPGRKSMVLDPKKMGFCRFECRPTEDLATCEHWTLVAKIEDLANRIK